MWALLALMVLMAALLALMVLMAALMALMALLPRPPPVDVDVGPGGH